MTGVNEAAAEKRGRSKPQQKQLPLPGFPEVVNTGGTAWDGVEPARLQNLVRAVTACGGAVILSQSPDGEVTGIMVLHDEHEKRTLWSRAGEETEARLVELEDYFIKFKDGEA